MATIIVIALPAEMQQSGQNNPQFLRL